MLSSFEPGSLKVIFLDFDGVLVTPTSSFRRSSTGTVSDPAAVRALNYLVGETGARLVITSTWRLEYSVIELAELLQRWGIRADILGCAPCCSTRSEEIQTWLDNYIGSAPIQAFVILDDLAEMGNLSQCLIRTEFEVGLTMSHAQRALEFLNPPA